MQFLLSSPFPKRNKNRGARGSSLCGGEYSRDALQESRVFCATSDCGTVVQVFCSGIGSRIADALTFSGHNGNESDSSVYINGV